jgi:hypothetical protein
MPNTSDMPQSLNALKNVPVPQPTSTMLLGLSSSMIAEGQAPGELPSGEQLLLERIWPLSGTI